LPVVEYRVCPMAAEPVSFFKTSSFSTSATNPMARCCKRSSPSADTIPHASCPRCCNANSPNCVSVEASAWPKMPKIPHSSCNLSRSMSTFTILDQFTHRGTESTESLAKLERKRTPAWEYTPQPLRKNYRKPVWYN